MPRQPARVVPPAARKLGNTMLKAMEQIITMTPLMEMALIWFCSVVKALARYTESVPPRAVAQTALMIMYITAIQTYCTPALACWGVLNSRIVNSHSKIMKIS